MDKMLIPPRYRLRVKQRLAIVEYALEYGVKPASRRFGLERKTVRRWRDRWRAEGLAGLVPRYPTQRPTRLSPELVALIEHARRVLEYGAPRVRVWLRRIHKRQASLAAIQRTFVRLGLPRLPRRGKRRSRPRQLTLFEKPMPGDSVQVDVKVVKIGGRKVFGLGRLHPLPGAEAVSTPESMGELGFPRRGAARLALPYPEASVRQRFRIPAGLFAERAGSRDPVSLHQAATSRAERQGRTQSPH